MEKLNDLRVPFFQSVYFSNLVSSPDMKTGLITVHDQVSNPNVDA